MSWKTVLAATLGMPIRRGVLVLGSALVACFSSTVTPYTTPSSPENAYPPKFDVVDEETLRRRTDAAQARSPGWTITLDPLGLLSIATCMTCSRGSEFTPEDEAASQAFLAKNEDLVQLYASGVRRNERQRYGMLFQQWGPAGIASFVMVRRIASALTISGHAFPSLPPAGESKADDILERDLRAGDRSPDLAVRRGYRRTAPSECGPVELREAVCLHSDADIDAQIGKSPPVRRCLDVRTGEDITLSLVRMTVSVTNGRVTWRLERPPAR